MPLLLSEGLGELDLSDIDFRMQQLCSSSASTQRRRAGCRRKSSGCRAGGAQVEQGFLYYRRADPVPPVDTPARLCGALNDVDARGGIHDAADLANLKLEGGVLKGLLHLARPELPQVSPSLEAPAVALLLGKLGKVCPSFDFRKNLLHISDRFLFGANYLALLVALGVAGLAVLDQDVARGDLLSFKTGLKRV